MSKFGTTIGRAACPHCISNGNDNHGDNLVLYSKENYAQCFACGFYTYKAHALDLKDLKLFQNKNKKPVITEFRYMDISRGVTKETCEKYSYACGFHNNQPVHISNFFVDGEIKYQQLRYLDKKAFTYTGNNEGNSQLFGLDIFDNNETLIITEGHIDAMLLHQETGYDVVSFSNGTNSAEINLRKNFTRLKKYGNIFIMTDNDIAGRMCRTNIRKLNLELNIEFLDFNSKYKDFGDIHKTGDRQEINYLIKQVEDKNG